MSNERCEIVFVLKCCMSLGRSLSGNIEWWGLGAPPIHSINVEIWRIIFTGMKQSIATGVLKERIWCPLSILAKKREKMFLIAFYFHTCAQGFRGLISTIALLIEVAPGPHHATFPLRLRPSDMQYFKKKTVRPLQSPASREVFSVTSHFTCYKPS